MRITLNRDTSLQPLQQVTNIVAKKQTHPILSNVLLSTLDNAGVAITATDGDLEIGTTIACEVKEQGAITVSAKKLTDIVRSLPPGSNIELTTGKNGQVSVVAGRSRFALATLSAADFPRYGEFSSGEHFSLPQKTLKNILQKTAFCMAVHDVRFFLNGLMLKVEDRTLHAVASDGHRLALAQHGIEGEDAGDAAAIIVPRKTVLELGRILEDSDSLARCEFSRKHIRISAGRFEILSKLIDDEFPDFSHINADAMNCVLTIPKADLKDALMRASILSYEKFRGVRFSLAESALTLVANNAEREEAVEVLPANYVGEPMDIAFNATYLLDALNAINDDTVVFRFIDQANSCCIRGQESNDTTYIVMPIKI